MEGQDWRWLRAQTKTTAATSLRDLLARTINWLMCLIYIYITYVSLIKCIHFTIYIYTVYIYYTLYIHYIISKIYTLSIYLWKHSHDDTAPSIRPGRAEGKWKVSFHSGFRLRGTTSRLVQQRFSYIIVVSVFWSLLVGGYSYLS